MADSDSPIDQATEIIQERGCPICGEMPGSFSYNGGAKIGLSQCGHRVSLQDARRLEELQDAIEDEDSKEYDFRI